VNLLRQIEVAVANGKTTALACKEAGSWIRRTSAGARSTRATGGSGEAAEGVGAGELEAEAFGGEPDLDNLVLKDFASGNF